MLLLALVARLVIGVSVVLVGREAIVAREPAGEIGVGAAPRTERPPLGNSRCTANRAGAGAVPRSRQTVGP